MAKNLNNDGVFVHHIAWKPPSGGSWKLHFSGYATADSCDGGAGFILRDQNAKFISAGAQPVENFCSIMETELMALRSGLCIAIIEGVDYLEVEGDSPTVIGMLNANLTPSSSRLKEIFEECVHYLDVFRDVKMKRVHSQDNLAARLLAGKGSGLKKAYFWYEEPCEITKVLIDDVIGRWECCEDPM